MTLLWVCFVLFLAYYGALVASNLIAYPRLIEAINAGQMQRTSLYWRMMAGLWVFSLIALLPAALGRFSPGDIGLGLRDFACPGWLRIAAYVIAGLYFLFLLTQTIALLRNFKRGKDSAQDIPGRLRAMLPASARERRVWAGAAVSAGVCEEIMFRGFLLHVLTALFPSLGLPAALGVATLLFGAGHLYQGPKEAAKPLLIGLMLGLVYIAFGTLLPCMLLHAMQDLEAGWAVAQPKKDKETDKKG